MGSVSFVSKNHSVGINAFHFEWCPKYRFAVLSGGIIRKVLTESLTETANLYGIQILALEVAADHLHIFVNLPPQLSVSKALQLFKGRSSKDIFNKCPSFRDLYHKHHFWSRGKFYRSVSNIRSDMVYNYITGHKNKELSETVSNARQEIAQLNLLAFV